MVKGSVSRTGFTRFVVYACSAAGPSVSLGKVKKAIVFLTLPAEGKGDMKPKCLAAFTIYLCIFLVEKTAAL